VAPDRVGFSDEPSQAATSSNCFPVIEGSTRFSTATLRWSVLPWVLVRTPGFPVSLIERLASPELLTESDHLADIRSEAEQIRSRLLNAIAVRPAQAGAAAPRELRNVERAASLNRPVSPVPFAAGQQLAGLAEQWNTVCAVVQSAEENLSAHYDAAYRRALTQVSHECADPWFGHVLFISSRRFYENFWAAHLASAGPGVPFRRSRQKLRTAARYLRRLTVRCEETSFFGPVHFAQLDPCCDRAVRLDDPGPERVYAEPSIWLLEHLTRHLYRDLPELDRPVRQHPLFRVDDDRLVRTTDGRSRRLSAAAVRLWGELPGQPSVGAAARALGMPSDLAVDCLSLLRPGLTPWTVPAHEMYPLECLLSLADDRLLRFVGEYRDAFAASPWPERRQPFLALEQIVTDQLGVDADVGPGRHYADRYVLHEERAHRLSSRTAFGAPVIGKLHAATEALLPLAYVAALLVRADARAALRSALKDRRLPLAAVVQMELPDATPRFSAFRADAHDVVKARVSDGIVQLTRQDVAALVARHCPPLDPADAYGTLAGPDWMMTAPVEDATWVLGELHDDGSYIAGGVTRVHPDGAALRSAFEQRVISVIDPGEMAAIVAKRRNKFLIPEMPGLAIEVGGRSVKPRPWAVPISEAEVAEDGTAVLVRGRRLRLYSGDIPTLVHRALAVPALNPVVFDTGPRTPRVLIDDTVIQRARWQLQLAGGLYGRQAWDRAQELRREHGLPRRLFVRHPAEPKPLFVDFADVLAVEDVMRLPSAPILVSEMLPDFGDLWWQPDGSLMCAELRMGCLVWLDLGRDTDAASAAPPGSGSRA
jgi:hypothetical protein